MSMVLKFATLILLTGWLCAFRASSQIPNNGFEDWVPVANCEDPMEWYSTNLLDTPSVFCPVSRSSDHFPAAIGSYSLRLENNPALLPSFRALGVALSTRLDGSDRPLFPVIGHPNSLCGYYKFDCVNRDTMSINVYLYDNGVELASGRMWVDSTVSSWTPFNIPIAPYVSADSARISILTCNVEGAGAQGNSVLHVDNLSFDTLIVSQVRDEPSEALWRLYPNPAVSWVDLELNSKFGNVSRVEVVDLSGRTPRVWNPVALTSAMRLELSELDGGIYHLRVMTTTGRELVRLLQIIR